MYSIMAFGLYWGSTLRSKKRSSKKRTLVSPYNSKPRTSSFLGNILCIDARYTVASASKTWIFHFIRPGTEPGPYAITGTPVLRSPDATRRRCLMYRLKAIAACSNSFSHTSSRARAYAQPSVSTLHICSSSSTRLSKFIGRLIREREIVGGRDWSNLPAEILPPYTSRSIA